MVWPFGHLNSVSFCALRITPSPLPPASDARKCNLVQLSTVGLSSSPLSRLLPQTSDPASDSSKTSPRGQQRLIQGCSWKRTFWLCFHCKGIASGVSKLRYFWKSPLYIGSKQFCHHLIVWHRLGCFVTADTTEFNLIHRLITCYAWLYLKC